MKPLCISLLVVHACVWCSADESLTIVTYNIHHGEGTDARLDVDRIARIVRAMDADVVCLQEVDQTLPRTQTMDMPRLLAEKIGMDVVFGGNYAFDGGLYGNATLTRLPIVESLNTPLPGPAAAEPRGCLRVTVRKGPHEIDVLNTHLGLHPDERREQASAIVDATRDMPTILAGDLNAEPGDLPLKILGSIFQDTCLGPCSEGTLTGSDTPRRIDYVLVSRRIKSLDSRVIDDALTRSASDHLPYVARVDLGAAPESLLDHGIPSNDDARLDDALLKEDDE